MIVAVTHGGGLCAALRDLIFYARSEFEAAVGGVYGGYCGVAVGDGGRSRRRGHAIPQFPAGCDRYTAR